MGVPPPRRAMEHSWYRLYLKPVDLLLDEYATSPDFALCFFENDVNKNTTSMLLCCLLTKMFTCARCSKVIIKIYEIGQRSSLRSSLKRSMLPGFGLQLGLAEWGLLVHHHNLISCIAQWRFHPVCFTSQLPTPRGRHANSTCQGQWDGALSRGSRSRH